MHVLFFFFFFFLACMSVISFWLPLLPHFFPPSFPLSFPSPPPFPLSPPPSTLPPLLPTFPSLPTSPLPPLLPFPLSSPSPSPSPSPYLLPPLLPPSPFFPHILPLLTLTPFPLLLPPHPLPPLLPFLPPTTPFPLSPSPLHPPQDKGKNVLQYDTSWYALMNWPPWYTSISLQPLVFLLSPGWAGWPATPSGRHRHDGDHIAHGAGPADHRPQRGGGRPGKGGQRHLAQHRWPAARQHVVLAEQPDCECEFCRVWMHLRHTDAWDRFYPLVPKLPVTAHSFALPRNPRPPGSGQLADDPY